MPIEVVVEMGGVVPPEHLRESCAGFLRAQRRRVWDHRAVAATVRESGHAIFDVSHDNHKDALRELSLACCELAGAREYSEAAWTKLKGELRKLSHAATAIELRLTETEQRQGQEVVEYDAAGRITGVRPRMVKVQTLHVTAW